MITAKIVADSINNGNRLTTFVLTYPRFIHAEFMTHRQISKNSSSSRAIPVAKVIQDIRENIAMPVHFGKTQKGMQAENEVDSETKLKAVDLWSEAANSAISYAEKLLELGIHKQVANRILEPFLHIRVLASGTDWDNLFALRYHKDAQPEFKALAKAMLDEYVNNVPNELKVGEWHIPFGDKMVEDLDIKDKLKVATARAARVSYMTFDNQIDYSKDYQLHDELFKSGHFSPFEHCATPHPDKTSNFTGWLQYRKTLGQPDVKTFDYNAFKNSR